jgi:hypothetical protein
MFGYDSPDRTFLIYKVDVALPALIAPRKRLMGRHFVIVALRQATLSGLLCSYVCRRRMQRACPLCSGSDTVGSECAGLLVAADAGQNT